MIDLRLKLILIGLFRDKVAVFEGEFIVFQDGPPGFQVVSLLKEIRFGEHACGPLVRMLGEDHKCITYAFVFCAQVHHEPSCGRHTSVVMHRLGQEHKTVVFLNITFCQIPHCVNQVAFIQLVYISSGSDTAHCHSIDSPLRVY